MGPLRSIKVRGLRGVGRLDVRLDGGDLVLVGPSGSGKSTLLGGIAEELTAELSGKPHPALDIEAVGGADQQIRIAFVSRPVQLRWERDFAGEWQKGAAVALHLDDARTAARGRGPFEVNAIEPAARVAPWLPGALAERHARREARGDPMGTLRDEQWISMVQDVLRSVLGMPRAALAFADGVCAIDLGDGRRPRLDELSRGHRAAIDLFAELALRVEAARRRTGQPGFDPPGVALIDAVERDLDPRLQRRLLPLLAQRFPNVQWIVATHSPLVALALDGATVLDLGARELRLTPTLRKEGLERLVERMVGAAAPAPPPRSTIPPPGRTTKPGGLQGDS